MGNRAYLAAVALTLTPSLAWTQVPLGPRVQVNIYTTGLQGRPAVSMDSSGRFVVVWHGYYQDGNQHGVFGRRYDAAAAPVDSEFQVNTFITLNQTQPRVGSARDGGFVVVWQSGGNQDGSNYGVFARRYDSSGAALSPGEFQVNSHTTSQQADAALAVHPDGRFVSVWRSSRELFVSDMFGQRFDAAGTPAGPEFQVNSDTRSSHSDPDVAFHTDGEFVVAYRHSGGGSTFFQRFDAGGAKVGGEVRVNSDTTLAGGQPSLAAQPDGGFIVVWVKSGGFGGGGIFGRRFDAAGSPVGAEFTVSSYDATAFWARPRVAADGEGNFVVVWQYAARDAYNDPHVFGRWHDAQGAPVGGAFRIDAATSAQRSPFVAAHEDGNFVVAWEAGGDVHVRRFAPDLIFRDGFESGHPSSWSASATDANDLSVSSAAALDSTDFGLQAVVDDSHALYVQDDKPRDESRYRARFYFDPNGFDPGEALAKRRTRLLIVFEEAPSRRMAAIVLRRVNGAYSLMGRCRLDDQTQADTGFFAITNAPHVVELDWRRSSGPEARDGSFQLWIDGTSVALLEGLANSASGVDFVRLGALAIKAGASGTLYLDEFESRRAGFIGP
jgi:hypothetical protein